MGQVLKSTRRQRVGQSQLDKQERDPKMKRIKKLRFRPGTREGIPLRGPFLYALAGRSTKFELTLVQRFDVTTGQWTPGPALDAPRAAFAVARAHDRIYVMGGSLNFEPLASVRSLGPYGSTLLDKQGVEILPKWRVESPMPYPRRFFAAASWRPAGDGGEGGGGQWGERELEAVFILGGAGKFHFADSAINEASYSSVLSYDSHRRMWVNHTDMPGGRRHHAAAVHNGRIYVFGGWRDWREQRRLDAVRSGGGGAGEEEGEEVELAEVASYDPVTREWRQEAPMPTARRGLQAVCCNGRLYALGGVSDGRQLATVESMDPAQGLWRKEPDMLERRSCFGAASFNGCIYVAAGIVGGYVCVCVCVFVCVCVHEDPCH
jgi:hypothetical protein